MVAVQPTLQHMQLLMLLLKLTLQMRLLPLKPLLPRVPPPRRLIARLSFASLSALNVTEEFIATEAPLQL